MIVTACILYRDIYYPGPTHKDILLEIISETNSVPCNTTAIYGFIDTEGNFHTRAAAFVIAESHGQLIDNPTANHRLHSYDLNQIL